MHIRHTLVIRVLELEGLFVYLAHGLDFGTVLLEPLAVDVAHPLVDPLVEVHTVSLVKLNRTDVHDNLVAVAAIFLRKDVNVVRTSLVGLVFLLEEEANTHLNDVVAVGRFTHLVETLLRKVEE